MKRLLFNLTLMALFLSGTTVWAGPFRSTIICVPKFIPSSSHLEFIAREGTPCIKGESYMKVVENGDGVTLLLPTDAPLPKDSQKELEEFKKYHGLEP